MQHARAKPSLLQFALFRQGLMATPAGRTRKGYRF